MPPDPSAESEPEAPAGPGAAAAPEAIRPGPAAAAGDERTLALLLFLLLFVSYAYFFQGGGWNPNSRLDLTRALAEQGSIVIDDYRGNTGDWAKRDDHYYSNKAPGLSFLSAPVFRVAWELAGGLVSGPARLGVAAYLTNLVVNALPAALMGVLLLRVLGGLGAGGPVQRAILVVAWGLGTLALPYATAYYAHLPAAVYGFTAYAALRGGRRLRPLLAGVATGLAVTVEHSALLLVPALGLAHAFDAGGRRRLAWAALGGLPFAVALAAYNDAAFGHPLVGAFSFVNPNVVERVDGALFGWPTTERLGALLFSQYRGLLWASPIFALAPFGLPALWRADRRSAALAVGVPVAFLLLVASFNAWHGGFSAGPRYLLPALPFLFLPTAFALRRLPVPAGLLVALSIGVATCITAVSVELPTDEERPLFGFVLPLLTRGHVSVNTYGFDDLYPARPWRNDFASFNLGELIWPHEPTSLLPLVMIQLVLGLAVLMRALALERGARSDRA